MSIIMDGSDPLVFRAVFQNGIRELTWPKTMMLKTAHIDSDVFELVDNKIQAESEWSGEGLPPVGLECEWHSDSQTGWQVVKVLAYSGQDAWIKVKGKCPKTVGNPANFRTVRTPEQIAAENRDAAIKEMQRLVGSCNTFPFAELYDYGYRLQVEK